VPYWGKTFIARQRLPAQTFEMPLGLIAAAALIGQSAEGSPSPASGTHMSDPAAPSECSPKIPDPNSNQIVICANKPQGYRIDPDVLEARREKKEALAGRPKPPENLKDHGCRVVGPAPCMDAPMINVLGAVATAADMAERMAKGQEVGSMFVTDPQPTEYQLYVEARKRRVAKEAVAAAKASKASHSTSADNTP